MFQLPVAPLLKKCRRLDSRGLVLGVTQDTYSGLGQIHEAYSQSPPKNCLRLAAVLTFHGAI
jgi:hypothetical protein